VRDPFARYNAPALEFEKATGLRGIHAPWRMPNDEPHAKVEYRHYVDIFVLMMSAQSGAIEPKAHGRVLALFDAALALNPGLKGLLQFREDPLQLHEAVMGITSQFNVADIAHFLLVPYKTYNEDLNLQAAREAVIRRTCVRLYWKPSPNTLGRILRLMDRNPRYATVPSHRRARLAA
jgi:hypothetical protein